MTLDGTRTFIVGRDRPVVVDPGPLDAVHLRRVLEEVGDGRVMAIVLTHAHPDHAGNTSALAEATGAPVYMGSGAIRLPFALDGARLLADGDVLDCEAGPLEAMATPGHTPEHLALWLTGQDGATALLAGDLILGSGDTTVVSHPEGDIAAYLRSLERVERRRPDLIIPSHGPVPGDADEVLQRFRRHRLRRVEEVRMTRAAMPGADAAELTRRIYGADLDPRLERAALGSVLAAIRYLDGSGEGESGGELVR